MALLNEDGLVVTIQRDPDGLDAENVVFVIGVMVIGAEDDKRG
jgi:hypothetical protein